MHKIRNELKRLLSIVLVAVMVFTFAPINAIAADLPESDEPGLGDTYPGTQTGEPGDAPHGGGGVSTR